MPLALIYFSFLSVSWCPHQKKERISFNPFLIDKFFCDVNILPEISSILFP